MTLRIGSFCPDCGHGKATDVACRWAGCACIAGHECKCQNHPRLNFLGLQRVRWNPAHPAASSPRAGTQRRGGRGASPMLGVAFLLAGASLAGLLVGPAGWSAVGLLTAVSLVWWELRR